MPRQLPIAPRYGLGQVGQPDPKVEDHCKLERLKTSRGQPDLMECEPEAIPGARVVGTLSGGYGAGGGAAEDHAEPWCQNVWENGAH